MFILKPMKIGFPVIFIFLTLVSCMKETVIVPVDGSAGYETPPRRLHEQFDFTAEDFTVRLAGINHEIAESPEEFLDTARRMLDGHPDFLILVDKDHLLNPGYKPKNLVDLSGYAGLRINKEGMMLERNTAEELVKISDAASSDGISLLISSAYRSYEYQEMLFQRFAELDGEESASRYSARAGASQHQLGTTVDFGGITNTFAESPAGIWMGVNAGRFGWSLSYPPDMESVTGYTWESWHWRWIGVDAVVMQNRFFGGVQQEMLEFWNTNAPVLTGAIID